MVVWPNKHLLLLFQSVPVMLTYLVLALFFEGEGWEEFVLLWERSGRGGANLKLTVRSVFHNAKDGADISSDSGTTEL